MATTTCVEPKCLTPTQMMETPPREPTVFTQHHHPTPEGCAGLRDAVHDFGKRSSRGQRRSLALETVVDVSWFNVCVPRCRAVECGGASPRDQGGCRRTLGEKRERECVDDLREPWEVRRMIEVDIDCKDDKHECTTHKALFAFPSNVKRFCLLWYLVLSAVCGCVVNPSKFLVKNCAVV